MEREAVVAVLACPRCGQEIDPAVRPRRSSYYYIGGTSYWEQGDCPTCFDRDGARGQAMANARVMGTHACPWCGGDPCLPTCSAPQSRDAGRDPSREVFS